MTIKILCIGDIHLGRVSSKLPVLPARSGLESPRTTLTRSIEAAISLKVDLTVFLGDVIDQSNAYFEAHGALVDAIKGLTQAGIPAYAVAGNHDYEALRALAQHLPGLKLLGATGGWEEKLLEFRGEKLRLVGKSFTAQYAKQNPLSDFYPPRDEIPTIGLLHCEVGSGGPYHPVTLGELELKAPSAWLLGHLHKPAVLREHPLIFYPGALHPLDPAETGAHGPWLLEVQHAQAVSAKQLSIAPLRYEQFEVTLEGVSSLGEARDRILESLSTWQNEQSAALNQVEAVIFRLTLTGQTAIVAKLPDLIAELESNTVPLFSRFFFERVVSLCRPRLSLSDLAQHSDPPGLLAKRLLILDARRPEDAYQLMLNPARRALESAKRGNPFLQAGLPELPDDEKLRAMLIQSGMRLLCQLLEQKSGVL